MHKTIAGVCFVLLAVGLTGCGSPQKDAAKAAAAASNAEADVQKEKARILEDYRKCVSKNPSDEQACVGYKSALDAM